MKSSNRLSGASISRAEQELNIRVPHHKAICFLEWMGPWKIFAAASKAGLQEISEALGFEWERGS